MNEDKKKKDKDRQMVEKSGRTEGSFLTRHLAQACFSLGEGRRKEVRAEKKGLTFSVSDWQTLTHTQKSNS